jgi:HEAT repeat protein
VAPEDSIRWLVAQAKQDRRDAATGQPIGENALAALAMHRGDPARDAMVGFTRDPRVETRKGSMFWLAMVRGAEAESERAITAALRNDADEEVREQAVFALSRLPDERATRALIGIAEDQSLPREQRRRAVFWLAQSESDSAQAYLEKVLARNAR